MGVMLGLDLPVIKPLTCNDMAHQCLLLQLDAVLPNSWYIPCRRGRYIHRESTLNHRFTACRRRPVLRGLLCSATRTVACHLFAHPSALFIIHLFLSVSDWRSLPVPLPSVFLTSLHCTMRFRNKGGFQL